MNTKIKPTTAWFVANPHGVVLILTSSPSRENAIRRHQMQGGADWQESERAGYRCVRLAIGPEK